MGLGNTGISSSFKRPGFIAKIIFGGGAVSAGSGRLKVLCVGMKGAAGTIVADGAPVRVTSEDEIDVVAAPGSQLACMAYEALKKDSVELWLAAVTEPSGGTAATATVVIGGSWSAGGVVRFRLNGKSVFVNVDPTDTIDDVGADLAAAFNAKTRLPATAAYNSATDTLTLTIKQKGASGKDWLLYHDDTDRPTGMTVTLAGSATVNTSGVRFGAASSGTGSEDVTTLLTKLQTGTYDRIAPAQNDPTNAALWESHVNLKAGALKLLLEQLVFGHNGTLSAAQSIAQTTLNAFRAQVVWCRNGENHPALLAARKAAIRSVTEQATWVPDYNGLKLTDMAPQAFEADIPTDPELDVALNNGVTPITTVNGELQVVRSITSYCLNGAVQDERCLDIGDAVMPDRGTKDLQLLWQDFRAANPYVGPDPVDGEEPPPEGVAYPKLWAAAVTERADEWYAAKWLEERPRDVWAPKYIFVKAGRYIAGDTPMAVRRIQHRVDNVIRQISNTA